MGILTASTQTYEFTLDEMKKLIASDLGVNSSSINVEYKIGDVGPGDPMDRYPAPQGVVGVKVTVNTKELVKQPAVQNNLASQIAAVESQTSQWGDH